MTEILTNKIKINNDDTALLTIIEQQLKNDMKSNLKKLFYILERNQILSTYAFNKNEIYKEIINSFMDNITLNDINLIMKMNIILELKIPNIKPNLMSFKKYIKENVLEKYVKNEDMLRTDLPDDDDEQKWKIEYRNQKILLEENTKNQIYKIKDLNEILKIKNTQVIKDFFNDLYIIFLSYNYQIVSTEKIKFLDIMIQIYILNEKNIKINFAEKIIQNHEKEIMENKYDEYYNDITKAFLFFESYSDFIYYTIDIYSDIYEFSTKIESEFIEALKTENFVYEKGERVPEYYAEVNSKLYKIYECLIFSMKKILYSFGKEKEKLLKFIQFIKSNMIKMGQLNSKFSFFSKEYFIFQNLILTLRSLEKKIINLIMMILL